MADAITDDLLRALVFEAFGVQRYVQDCPVRPDLWMAYIMGALRGEASRPVSRILTPRRTTGPDGRPVGGTGAFVHLLEDRLGGRPPAPPRGKRPGGRPVHGDDAPPAVGLLAATTRHVVADLTFEQMLRGAMANTSWWLDNAAALTQPAHLFRTLIDSVDGKDDAFARKALAVAGQIEVARFVVLTAVILLIARPFRPPRPRPRSERST